MKTKLWIIIGILTVIPISVLFTVDDAYALCMPNSDWPDAPCYGCIGCYPGLEQEKLDWEPYFDYNGSIWMEEKKKQLETTIQNNSLREWFKQSNSSAHENVYRYYFLQGDTPNRYGQNFSEALDFERIWNAVEDNSTDAPILIWNYHDVIFDGTLIETDLTQTIDGDYVPLYTLKVNEYFKGEKNADIITAVENPDDVEFNLFENGLFYLKKLESSHEYTVTIASAKTFGNCDARNLIEISPVLPNEKPSISTPALTENFVDLCVPDYYDIDPDEMILEDEKIIPPPRKQMKLGIKLAHIICDKDKYPVWNTHYKPACVYPDSESELIKRGWAKLRLMLPAGPDPIKELDWMGRNVMSMMLEGTFSYNSTPVETLDEKRAAVWEYSEQYHPGEQYLEYAIIPHQYHYDVGDKVQFDLLEWGNYSDCWNLKLRIIDKNDQSVFENNSEILCPESDGVSGIFNSYSMKEDLYPVGGDFDEFVCDKPGYYRIEVSNEDVFPSTILQNFACLESESKSTYTLTEVNCFTNQVIYNDECVYVLTPDDEFPEEMIKYFLMVDGVILNFCEIGESVTSGQSESAVTLESCYQISSYTISDVSVIEFEVAENEN